MQWRRQEHTAAQGLYLSDLRTVCESLELQLRHERASAQRTSAQPQPAPDPALLEVRIPRATCSSGILSVDLGLFCGANFSQFLRTTRSPALVCDDCICLLSPSRHLDLHVLAESRPCYADRPSSL